MSLSDELYQLESSLIDAGATDYARAVLLLADDYVEFGRSGRVYNKLQALEMMRQNSRRQISILDFAIKRLTNEAVLITYRTQHQAGTVIETLRSSIWVKNNEKWQIIFHQGTPASTAE